MIRRPGEFGRATVGRSAFVTEEMGLMRRKTLWGAGPVLAAWLALVPGSVNAQGPFNSDIAPGSPGYAPASPQLPIPLGSTRPEDGGLFVAAEGLLYLQTNPLRG